MPSTIDRYQVERRLGAGGFGRVYLAHDPEMGRKVAIKVLVKTFRAGFEEQRAVACLEHANIVPVYDAGTTADGRRFIVSKYIEGGSLAQRIRRQRPSRRESAQWVATVAEALHHAHSKKIVHRDIKPSNILLDHCGTPHITDFGLALREEDLAVEGPQGGTPAYMSPEQARAEGHLVDGRSDIFGLGIILYELLTGERPFGGSSRVEVAKRISSLDARPPRQLDDTIPKELERICLKALQKDLKERYTTAQDMADELRRFLGGTGTIWTPPSGAAARAEAAAPGKEWVGQPKTAPPHAAFVFIAYRHTDPDASVARELARVVSRAGHEVFIDTGIRWGADWVDSIREALLGADYFVVLLSPEAAKSEMLAEEVALANSLAEQRQGSPVILPIRVCYPLNEPLPYHLSLHLRTLHHQTWDGPQDTSLLAEQLLAAIADGTSWCVGHQDHAMLPVRVEPSTPAPCFDPRSVVCPGGALDIESNLYVVRDADREVLAASGRPRAVVTVQGPRQTGKTSLAMRAYAATRSSGGGIRTVFVDLQAPSHDELRSLDALWRFIAERLVEQLQIQQWRLADWLTDRSYEYNLCRVLDRFVFSESKTPVLVFLDEVDRVFNAPVKSEFFASIRAFFNRGAFDPTWKAVRWLLVTSTEPSFFIDDIAQSPFNIGLRVQLTPFTRAQVDQLALRYGVATDHTLIDRIMTYLGGHPYLVNLLLYRLTKEPTRREALFGAESCGGGVFREHLHRFLMHFQRDRPLSEAMESVIAGNGCQDLQQATRLEAAGLVCRDECEKVVPLCQLYADFFKSQLSR
jgi:hypothetical protein